MTVANKHQTDEAPAVVRMTGDPPRRGPAAKEKKRKDWRQYDGTWADSLAPALRALAAHPEGLTTGELAAALNGMGVKCSHQYAGQVSLRLRKLGMLRECGVREWFDARMGKRFSVAYALNDLGAEQLRWFESNPALRAKSQEKKGNDSAS